MTRWLACLAFLASISAATLRAEVVHHVVLIQFEDEATPAQIVDIENRFVELPGLIPGVVGMQWGRNNSPEGLTDGYTHAFVLTFESQAALDAYGPHQAHVDFVKVLRPILARVFVSDFATESALPPAEPGRTHHLVFFRYKADATAEQKAAIPPGFRELEAKISGVLSVQHGETRTQAPQLQGFEHSFWVTFTHERARDDYLPHPAHKAFVEKILPILEQPLVIDFTVRPTTRSLFVTSGLEPYRVYQRGEDDTTTLSFGGIAQADGPIEARLRQGRRTVSGFDWRRVGEATGGEFAAELTGVPTGGEYTVEVRRLDPLGNVASHTEVANILVGDIWILAGQSNMEGVGNLIDVEEPHPLVHCFTMAHRWELAAEPLHWLVDSPDPVHSEPALRRATNEADRRAIRSQYREARTKGAGLGLAFAKSMVEATGVPVGLIASAHGGTSMKQWDPAGKGDGGASLYGSMHKQVQNAGGRVRGVLWYQGESDANPSAVQEFAERFAGLVAAFRSDFGADLPFYYVQIGRFVVDRAESASWNEVQDLQRRAEDSIPGVGVVAVIDLPLDDLIHVGTDGLKRTGRRLAKIAQRELFGASYERGPRTESVKAEAGRRRVVISYSGVNGSLLADGEVRGFSVHDAEGERLPIVYTARVDAEDPHRVILELQNPAPDGATLSYGDGLDPVCNLVDEEDMAALVFRGVAIE